MPRHDDRYGNTRLYVGHLSSRTRSRDLDYIFSKYGRIRDVDMKRNFAFVDFSDPRDADDARYSLNRREIDGSRIVVEFCKGTPRGSREYMGRGPLPGTGRCFNCGIDGHWARDCRAGDWKNKCYRCGERGHIEKNCKNSPKKLRHGRSYSRSPVRTRSLRHGQSRSQDHVRDESYSRSRSPVKRGRMIEQENERSRSPCHWSPEPKHSLAASNGRKHSQSPNGGRPRDRELKYSGSPRMKSRSASSSGRGSPGAGRHRNSSEGSRSRSPRNDGSPADNYYDSRRSPIGSESP